MIEAVSNGSSVVGGDMEDLRAFMKCVPSSRNPKLGLSSRRYNVEHDILIDLCSLGSVLVISTSTTAGMHYTKSFAHYFYRMTRRRTLGSE